jgi:hypothetical protein
MRREVPGFVHSEPRPPIPIGNAQGQEPARSNPIEQGLEETPRILYVFQDFKGSYNVKSSPRILSPELFDAGAVNILQSEP